MSAGKRHMEEFFVNASKKKKRWAPLSAIRDFFPNVALWARAEVPLMQNSRHSYGDIYIKKSKKTCLLGFILI